MSRKKILIINDDRASNNLLAQTLGPQGCDVITVENPEDGLAAAGETKPDLIFLSLLFPQSNGLKISKTIHSLDELKNIPIIMLISYQGELDPKYTLTVGVVDVLVKPLNDKEILSKTLNFLGPYAPEDVVEGSPAGTPVEDEMDIASLDREWFADLEKEEAEFVQEGDRLIDQAILSPMGGPFMSGLNEEEVPQAAEKTGGPAGEEPEEEVQPEPELEEETPEAAPVMSGQKATEEDETKLFLAEEDVQDKEPVAREPAASAEEKQPVKANVGSQKRVSLIAASVLIIVGIGAGALVVNKFFFGAPPAIKEMPVEKTPAVAVKKEEPPAAATAKEAKAESPSPAAEKPQNETAVTAKDMKKPAKEKIEDAKTAGPKKMHGFAVQVGVFAEEKNALSLAGKLKQKGYDTSVLKDEKKPLHRVLIGRFDTNKKAVEEARSILQKDGIKAVVYSY